MNNPSKVIVAYRSKNYTICFKSFGFPRPVVSLYGVISNIPRLVTMNATFRFSNSCLEFRSARLEDGGEYMLQAKNCFGSSVKKFRLKIFGTGNFCKISYVLYIIVMYRKTEAIYRLSQRKWKFKTFI
jgi:hypothetical protein